MSKPEALTQLRRLLTFLEGYAAEHPDFARQLDAALDIKPKAPRTARPKAAPLAVDVLTLAVERGVSAVDAHLEGADDTEVRAHAKSLKLKVSKKDSTDEVRRKILTSLDRELDRGGVFSRG